MSSLRRMLSKVNWLAASSIRLRQGAKKIGWIKLAKRIGVSLFLFITVGELFLRVVLGNNSLMNVLKMNQSDPACLSFLPNSSVRYTGIYKRIPPMTHKINQYGYRGEPRSSERKNLDAFRIVIVGDSMSFCPGLSDGDDYPSRLERRLKKELGRKVEVINLAVPGMNLEEVAAAVETRAMSYHPDALLVQVCANDFNESLCALWKDIGKTASFAFRHSYLARMTITLLIGLRGKPVVLAEEQNRRTVLFFQRLRAAAGKELPIALVSFGIPGKCRSDCPIEKSCNYNIPHFPMPHYLKTQMTYDGSHLDKINAELYVQRLAPWLLEKLERGCAPSQ